MRKFTHPGVCSCCGRVGSVWSSFGESGSDPDLCDNCEDAQRRWDAWQRKIATPTCGYPYRDPPPKTPPIRR